MTTKSILGSEKKLTCLEWSFCSGTMRVVLKYGIFSSLPMQFYLFGKYTLSKDLFLAIDNLPMGTLSPGKLNGVPKACRKQTEVINDYPNSHFHFSTVSECSIPKDSHWKWTWHVFKWSCDDCHYFIDMVSCGFYCKGVFLSRASPACESSHVGWSQNGPIHTMNLSVKLQRIETFPFTKLEFGLSNKTKNLLKLVSF